MSEISKPEDPKDKSKRVVGAFPRVSFKKVLELAEATFKVGQGEPARRISVFDELGGKSADSGTSRQLVTTANSQAGYGLIKGSYHASHLELTDVGRLVSDPNTSSVDKYRTILTCIFKNDSFSKFLKYWQDKPIPRDDVAVDWIVRNLNLPEKDAKNCWQVIKENINDFDVYEVASEKQIIVSAEVALENFQNKLGQTYESEKVSIQNLKDTEAPILNKSIVKPQSSVSAGNTQIHFNIQIHLPEKAEPEIYNQIFKSISEYLIGRKDN